MNMQVIHGDALDVLSLGLIAEESIDAIVTDPPYGLGFMGKDWDALPPGREWAEECLRVLKPGGHLLAFGGTRTWHRLAVAIEDAGFELRDSIAWLYGSGFSKAGLLGNKPGIAWCECGENPVPYSHADNADLPRVRKDLHSTAVAHGEGEDGVLLTPVQRGSQGSGVGEARAQGSGSLVAGNGREGGRVNAWREEPSLEGRQLHRAGQGLSDDQEAGAPPRPSERVRSGTPVGDGVADRSTGDAARGSAPHRPRSGEQPAGEPEAVSGSHSSLDGRALRSGAGCPQCGGLPPAYKGFAGLLKPAFEPIVVARKPLRGTVAANVLAHGTGALNIDGCRIHTAGSEAKAYTVKRLKPGATLNREGGNWRPDEGPEYQGETKAGRWPANVVLDENQAAALDEQAPNVGGNSVGADPAQYAHRSTVYEIELKPSAPFNHPGGKGGASRFFYVAKAPKKERPTVDGIAHPTVKPLALMRWLVRLVTPPGGTVLDPFAGSGTTGEAAELEGFDSILIEREADYVKLIKARLVRDLL